LSAFSSIQQSPLFVAIQRHKSTLTGGLIAMVAGLSIAVSADDHQVTQTPDKQIPENQLPVANPDEPRVAAVRNLDWVEAAQMNEEQRSQVASNCCGAYIEPQRTYPDANIDPEQASLLVNANTTETLADNVALLDGDVQISQGYRQIRSNSARIDQTNRTVVLEGNVQFREPGLLLLGKNAEIDIDSKEVQIEDATYVLHEASVRGKAENLQRTKDGVITISDATYSTCEPGDTTWLMATSEISIDQESGFATVKNAQLKVKDIPVFYFPWIKFPVNDRRSSGLLFPTLNVDSSNGLDYAQPIYWNLAENYDATITPRLVQERGIGLELEFRHLSQYAETEISGGFLGDDKGGKDENDIDADTGLPEHLGEDRYLMGLSHLGGIGKSWSTFLDLNKVSDNDYLNDLGNMSQESNSLINLRRVAGATYKTEHWDYLVEARDNQIIVDGLEEQYSVLPKIDINGYYRFDNSMVVDLNNQSALFDHDNRDFVTGIRNRLDYGVSWDKRWTWGYFQPQLRVKHLSYDLDSDGASLATQSPSVTVPVASVDSSIFFERDFNLFGGYTQTLEPRLYYLKAEFRDQSDFPDFDTREFTPSYDRLFRDERFNGGDRISDEERLTIALTTRFIDKKSGQERFTASIAQSINYIDRRVTLSSTPSAIELAELSRRQSPLALKLSGRMNVNWRFTSDIIYDTHDSELGKSSFSLRYNDRQNRLFNATYRSTQRDPRLLDGESLTQDIRQADISGFVPLEGNFNLVGRWNHDFTNSRALDVFAGFEYNSCCWRASLVARRWLDRKDEVLRPEEDLTMSNGIFFQIQFKGLAGSGGRVDSMLNNGIYGYGSEENL
jgi:LPS-assembly protein